MEQQTELIAAAHAVRTWVRAQRVTWAGDAPLPVPVTGTSTAAFVDVTALRAPLPIIEPEVPLTPEPEPVIELPSLAPFLRRPEPITSVYVESPRRLLSAGLLTRAAVLLASCSIVGTGGFVAWKRYASAPRTGTAVIESAPAGAQVFVDGQAAGTTPLRIDLRSGRHALELRLKGESRTQEVRIARGVDTPVTIDWSTRAAGSIQISSTPPGARVLVDGHERGVTPLELSGIAAGAHVVQLESEDGSVRRHIDVSAGRTEVIAESIYPGWVHVSAPFDVVVSEGSAGVQLDGRNQSLLKAGPHTLRLANRALGFAETRQVVIEPGTTTDVSIASPMSTLTVSGPGGAAVLVDGERVGEVPLAAYPVKLGTRDVTIVEPSGATHHRSLTITSQPATLDIKLP